jgi:hypothetical protein
MNQLKQSHHDERDTQRSHASHGWMMVICIPLLVVAVVLVATGVASAGFLVGAIACMAMMGLMMAMMMRGMSGGGK